MENRAFKRHVINLAGRCSIPGGGNRAVMIRDFCPGGMLLSCEQADEDGKPQTFTPSRGDIIEIHCSIPAPAGGTPLFFQGRVVHIDAASAGIVFINPDFDALHELYNFAKTHPSDTAKEKVQQFVNQAAQTGAKKSAYPSAKTLLLACNKMAEELVQPIAQAFLEKAADRLFTVAGEVQGISDKNACYDALKILKDHADAFSREFEAQMHDRLGNAIRQVNTGFDKPEPDFSEFTLSLVEKDELEDWLVFSDTARKVEAEFQESLSNLEQRLSVLCKAPIDKENNPFGPASFSQAFQNALNALPLERKAVQVSYAVFKDVLLATVGGLYDKLNRHLIENGVLPDLARTYKVKISKTSPVTSPSESPARLPAGGSSHQPQPAPDWYQLVQQLSNFSQHAVHRPDNGAPTATTLQFSPPPIADTTAAMPSEPAYYSSEELLFALSHMGRGGIAQTALQQDQRQDVKSMLLSTLEANTAGEGHKQIPEREAKALEVAEILFDSVLADKLVANNVRPWLQQLSVPLYKMAIRDDSVFSDKSHVARQLINNISQLELYGEEGAEKGTNAIRNKIDSLISEITMSDDVTPELFGKALQQVNALIILQRKAFKENLLDLAAKCEKDEALQKIPAPSASKLPPERPGDESLLAWKAKAGRLKVGNWLLLDVDSSPQRLRLGWIAKNFDRYVFVNVKGQKAATLNHEQLAQQLLTGTAVVLDDGGEPLIDRAQYSMLQNIHRQLLHETTHDHLTGLINRREFERHLVEALESAHRLGIHHVVCHLNLNQFGLVNSTFGYGGGDRLLVEISQLLQKVLGDRGLLARIGGNEFGILLENCAVEEAVKIVTQQKNAIQDYRFTDADKSLSISFSAGLIPITPDSESAATLLQATEVSCRMARGKGTNYIQVYHADDSELSRRMRVVKWVAKIDEALDSDSLVLRYQPIVKITGEGTAIHHSEILLGVPDVDGKLISPQDFILAAEHYRRMPAVDRWVIERTFRWMVEQSARLTEIGGLAINLSGASLNEEGLIDFILEQAIKTQVPMDKLCFEITETAGVTNLSSAAEFILTLKKTGCMFSLDDFGSGMSSYAYLKNLPVDFLKIDGAFVKNMDENPYDYAVVKSIAEIGHFMGKKIIAEYVETPRILDMLREIGVDYAQGYAIARPRNLIDSDVLAHSPAA
jgi:diguanylate cyclase (GGDEF)-like protein